MHVTGRTAASAIKIKWTWPVTVYVTVASVPRSAVAVSFRYPTPVIVGRYRDAIVLRCRRQTHVLAPIFEISHRPTRHLGGAWSLACRSSALAAQSPRRRTRRLPSTRSPTPPPRVLLIGTSVLVILVHRSTQYAPSSSPGGLFQANLLRQALAAVRARTGTAAKPGEALKAWSARAEPYFRMFTARAITRSPTTTEIAASTIIMSFAHGLIAETSVGLNAIAVSNDKCR